MTFRGAPSHSLAKQRHVIEDVSYATETIECSCGEVITAEPDRFIGDRHEPLSIAWAAHRRANGERALSVAQAAMNHRGFS